MSYSPIRQEVRLIGKHSAIYGVGQVLSRAVGFFMIPVYTRYILPCDYGALELVEVISGLLGLLFAMGVAHAMPQFYYSQERDSARNQIVTTIVIGFAVVSFPIVLVSVLCAQPLAVLLFERADYALPLALSLLATWFGVQCQIGQTYLRMRYRAKTFVVVTIGQLLVAVCLNIAFVVYCQMSFVGICYSTIISQGLFAVLLSVGILREVYTRPSLAVLKRLVLFGLPLVPLRLASDFGTAINRFVLRYFASPDPVVGLAYVGLFSLANKFGVIVHRFIGVPFNSFWVPRCRELLYEDEKIAKRVLARVCTYSTVLSVFVALLIAATAENCIEIMADPEYHGAATAVPILALACVILGMENHFLVGITYREKTRWAMVVGVVSLISILVASFLLVPPFGLVGAALAHLTAFSARTVLLYVLNQRLFPIPYETRRIFTAFGVAVVLYLASQSVSTSSVLLTLGIRLTIGGAYPAVLALVGFYHWSEIAAAGRVCATIWRWMLPEPWRARGAE